MSIALTTVPVFTTALTQARTIDLSSYTLRQGAVRDALLTAARTGAHVRVRLERDPVDDPRGTLHAANAATIAVLKAAGADAALTSAGEPVLHMKAALVDGVAWLDDRNWAGEGRETVVRDDDPADVAAVGAALAGQDGGSPALGLTKFAAQARELDVIRQAGESPLAVESESFGSGRVYNALLARARAGEPTRLLVARREAAQAGARGETELRRLARLEGLGVEVRMGVAARDLDEKLAVGANAAWAGSANATYAGGGAGAQRDWGLQTSDSTIVDGLRAAFERNWDEALALPPQSEPSGARR